MRLALALAAVSAVALFSTAASAQAWSGQGRYVSVAGGYVGSSSFDYDVPVTVFSSGRISDDVESGYGLQVAAGQSAGTNFRAEVALAYRNQDLTSSARFGGMSGSLGDGAVKAFSLDLNGYYDFPVQGPVRPYVGLGAGVASIDIDDRVIDDTGSTLNLQAMAGASLALSPRASLFAEARYQRLGTIELETSSSLSSTTYTQKIDLDGVNAMAGVRFGF